MPTTRPRYTITDTGNLREQLDQAQRRWPDAHDRRQLLLRLVTAGHKSIEREAIERAPQSVRRPACLPASINQMSLRDRAKTGRHKRATRLGARRGRADPEKRRKR